MIYLLAFIIVISVVFLIIGLYRNRLVYKYRNAALKEVSALAHRAIDKGEDWRVHHEKFDNHASYDSMFWDLSKWSYSDFYPDIHITKFK